MAGDASFPEKLVNIDYDEVTDERIDMVTANFLTHPEWDPVAAGKIVTLAEITAKWVVAIKDHHMKRLVFCSVVNHLYLTSLWQIRTAIFRSFSFFFFHVHF